jgi:ribosomal protein S18 acetylase RimI-like enzyme
MTARIRQARAADVPVIVALVEGSYRGEGSRSGWTTEADLLDGHRTDVGEVGAIVEGPGSSILVAEGPGGLLGSVQVQDAGDAAYIGMLAVRPGLQRGGLGSALLAAAERHGREAFGRPRARMTVIGQREALITWYERRGWRRTGERRPFPYGEPRFGIPRRPDLYFEVLEKPLR